MGAAIRRVLDYAEDSAHRGAFKADLRKVCAAAARAPAEGAGPVACMAEYGSVRMLDFTRELVCQRIAYSTHCDLARATITPLFAAPPAPSVAPAGREDALTYHGLWKMVNSGAVDGKGRDFYRVMHLTTKESVGKYLTKLQAELVEAAMNKAEVIDAAREGEKP